MNEADKWMWCPNGMTCFKKKQVVERGSAIEDYVLASDYAALADRHAHALAIERGKLEKADAENDRLAARVARLESFAIHVRDNTRDGAANYSGVSLHALACSALADGEKHES